MTVIDQIRSARNYMLEMCIKSNCWEWPLWSVRKEITKNSKDKSGSFLSIVILIHNYRSIVGCIILEIFIQIGLSLKNMSSENHLMYFQFMT